MALAGRFSKFYFQFHLNSTSSQVQCENALVTCRNLCTQVKVKKFNWGNNKTDRNVLKRFSRYAEPKQEEISAPLRAAVRYKYVVQGDHVRSLKAENAADIPKAEAQRKTRKEIPEHKKQELTQGTFDRKILRDMLRKRFFYERSFAIYGGGASQFDFGPMGCAIKNNILSIWRNFFILEENMLEIECPILTPKSVLRVSGHVDNYSHLIVKDVKTGECFPLHQVIKSSLKNLMTDKNTPQNVRQECENICLKLDRMTRAQMTHTLRKYNIKSPITGNDLTDPMDYCSILETHIGPTDVVKGFLRPETAEGIFVNFKRLLFFNNGKLPFAAAQIGKTFRNGITPREFTLAEIEHFCDPEDKSHPKFQDVANTPMFLYSACNQMDGKSPEQMTIGEAVRSGMVSSETLGYFMAKIQLFLLKIGLNPNQVRFRQHMSNEMAHYACDCWDAEYLTSYGWIECVACTDRSVYDLTQHSKATSVNLVAERKLQNPKTITVKEVVPNKELIHKVFEGYGKAIIETLGFLPDEAVLDLEKQLKEKGSYDLIVKYQIYKVTDEVVSVKTYEKKIDLEEFTPNVIESSFGIERIMYSLFEQSFVVREFDHQRSYLALPALVAPIKCSLLPLFNKPEFSGFIKQLSTELTKLEVSHKVDYPAGSMGRRYARTDEIAIPYGVTIDFNSLQAPHSATVRERDSMCQVRVPMDEIPGLISDLSKGKMSWSQVEAKYPKFKQQESNKSQVTVGGNVSSSRKSGGKVFMRS